MNMVVKQLHLFDLAVGLRWVPRHWHMSQSRVPASHERLLSFRGTSYWECDHNLAITELGSIYCCMKREECRVLKLPQDNFYYFGLALKKL